MTISGWWFVAIFYFPINIGLLIIPTDKLIFFRGVARNHQLFKSDDDPVDSGISHATADSLAAPIMKVS